MNPQDLVRLIDFDRLWLVIVIMPLGYLFGRLIDRWGRRLASESRKMNQRIQQFLPMVRASIYTVMLVILGSQVLVLERSTAVGLFGLVLLVVGFVLKDVLASVTGYVVILADSPFKVGDRVSFGDSYGEIREIGMRSTRLQTLDDNLVTIPNSKFLTEAVASATGTQLHCMVVIPFYVAAGEDFERARQIIAEAAATSRYVYLDEPVVSLVSDEFMGERFVTVIRVKAYVFDAKYEKAFASDVTIRVKRALRAAGIRGPDQQYRDLELNQGREMPLPPAAAPSASTRSETRG